MRAGEYLSNLIKDSGISGYTLAKKCGVSQSTLSNIIRRGNDPTIYTLQKICEGLNISVTEFWTLVENKDKDMEDILKEYFCYKDLISEYKSLNRKQQKFIMESIKLFKVE